MDVNILLEHINSDFFVGVPDSQLKALCNYLMKEYGMSEKHIIAPNEGNAVGLAAGYHLSTGKIPVIYMQNSGIGNAINPIASLLNDKVYAIPCIFIIGWRGEPGVYDEPQHIFQGEVTMQLLTDMDILAEVIGKETTEKDIIAVMERFNSRLKQGKSVAFVVRNNALQYNECVKYKNDNIMLREDIIENIVRVVQDDIIISTTGKASRELFEIRERQSDFHKHDFLTVGSMGHSSSIALSIALNKPKTKIWCIDGDGAALMHMGAMALIGRNKPENMVHVMINNGAHETVGGMPTIGKDIDWLKIADGCGYTRRVCVYNFSELEKELQTAKKLDGLTFIEVKAAIGSRRNLGRPTITARKNKEQFMASLKEKF